MKAVRVRTPARLETLEVFDAEEPRRPGPGEISVRLRASSLNFHDFAVVAGMIPTVDGRIPLSDGAGEVVEIGPGVTEFAVGDLVVSTFFPGWLDGEPQGEGFKGVPGDGADGYARERATGPVTSFTAAPKGWSAAESATLTCAGLTAWRALIVDGRAKPGDRVLVQGTGGVSIFALQIAKAMGCEVVATSSSDAKLERLKGLGADHVLNYKETPEWGKAVRKLAGGVGVDHVVEIGGSGTLPNSIAATRTGGHIAMIGVLTGLSGEVPTGEILGRQITVQGLVVGSRSHQKAFIRALELNGLRPVLDQHFPLEDLANAFRRQAAGAHFGKIVVDI